MNYQAMFVAAIAAVAAGMVGDAHGQAPALPNGTYTGGHAFRKTDLSRLSVQMTNGRGVGAVTLRHYKKRRPV